MVLPLQIYPAKIISAGAGLPFPCQRATFNFLNSQYLNDGLCLWNEKRRKGFWLQ